MKITTAGDICKQIDEQSAPPADAAPAKAGDREAADKWAAVVIQQTRLHSSLQDEDAINLARSYIAEREASAALREALADIDKAYTAYSQRNGDAQILMAELVQAIIRGGNKIGATPCP